MLSEVEQSNTVTGNWEFPYLSYAKKPQRERFKLPANYSLGLGKVKTWAFIEVIVHTALSRNPLPKNPRLKGLSSLTANPAQFG